MVYECLSNTIVIYGINGGIAQLARAFGSYPKGHRFKSYCRYQLSVYSLGGKTISSSKPALQSRRVIDAVRLCKTDL